MAGRMQFGVFLPPYHGRSENPSLALHRDLWLVEHIDRLGFDEVWVGEHHSAAFENIGSPELFIATAAERTRHIRLGTGVVSLAYHNPLMLAERINYLDHVTRGRVMLGVGPGALPSDAYMLGIPLDRLRPRMDEALDVLIPLMRGEVVNAETDWFKLREARMHMNPWSTPSVEMAVTSLISPNGAIVAGRHGLGILSLQALGKEAIGALATNWAIAEETAAKHGQTMDRAKWRIVLQMHLAETREQAVRDCRFGLEQWADYFTNVANLPLLPDDVDAGDFVQAYADHDVAVIGTPDDAIAAIERVQEATGGFGSIMLMAHDWANTRATEQSFELFARYVMPRFTALNASRDASVEWVMSKRGEWQAEATDATMKAFAKHAAESQQS
ncbi:MAG: LLM class flavin-dependent oxidoreductase [Novosphingobium sp.]